MEDFHLRAAHEGARTELSRRALLARGLAVAGALSLGGLRADPSDALAWPPASAYAAEVPTAWFDLALDLVRATPGFSPPVASRAFGYAGAALHEALAAGLSGGSFAGRLNGLSPPPAPANHVYHWPTTANAALAAILRALFPTASAANLDALDALERRFAEEGRAVLPFGVYKRSVRRGQDVAAHVFAWSTSDGGHEGFRSNFPPYTPPTGPGLWEPTPPGFQPALQPYWGTNRPFALSSGATCAPPPPLPYSEVPGRASTRTRTTATS